MQLPGVLRFEERYFGRIWGGRKLETLFGRTLPGGPIGEAWLVSDHAQHVSVVAEGPLRGTTLRELVEAAPAELLGNWAKLTPQGRFPLLLKILDAAEPLSIQVHPSDADAIRLHEPDVGKTEMWHILSAEDGSELFCGFRGRITRARFEAVARTGDPAELLHRIPAKPGLSVFVAAGTVHAIGAGIVLSEIQQNSDITYRVSDWGRLQDDGTPRALHLEKAAEVARFDTDRAGAGRTLEYTASGARHRILGACTYFAGEEVSVEGASTRETRGDSFHIVQGKAGELRVSAGGSGCVIERGDAVLVPGQQAVLLRRRPGRNSRLLRTGCGGGHSHAIARGGLYVKRNSGSIPITGVKRFQRHFGTICDFRRLTYHFTHTRRLYEPCREARLAARLGKTDDAI